MTFAEARALEAFKSLVHIAVPGLRFLALLNGGAAVALLAYLGDVAGNGMPTPDVRVPMPHPCLGSSATEVPGRFFPWRRAFAGRAKARPVVSR
jgi:hypothetical protein